MGGARESTRIMSLILTLTLSLSLSLSLALSLSLSLSPICASFLPLAYS